MIYRGRSPAAVSIKCTWHWRASAWVSMNIFFSPPIIINLRCRKFLYVGFALGHRNNANPSILRSNYGEEKKKRTIRLVDSFDYSFRNSLVRPNRLKTATSYRKSRELNCVNLYTERRTTCDDVDQIYDVFVHRRQRLQVVHCINYWNATIICTLLFKWIFIVSILLISFRFFSSLYIFTCVTCTICQFAMLFNCFSRQRSPTVAIRRYRADSIFSFSIYVLNKHVFTRDTNAAKNAKRNKTEESKCILPLGFAIWFLMHCRVNANKN